MPELQLSGISKSYRDLSVIKNLNLSVSKGEFVSLLGPSGCGKSTTLSMIAGLSEPTEGEIRFRDNVVVSVSKKAFIEPEHRDFGVVFQSYALWPHMTVEQNLAFPLKVRKMPAAERRKRIQETLELVGLAGFDARYPGQLSGGQQQRVGLARALVYRPSLLLLDEPLSNLDALLREQARVWLKEIQLRLGMTTIYVTHDQTEALALSDRIVVMNGGNVEQNGTPEEIYDTPETKFVAEFVGSANFVPATVDRLVDDRISVKLRDGTECLVRARKPLSPGQKIVLSIRPEKLSLTPYDGANGLSVQLQQSIYVGERHEYQCSGPGAAARAYGLSKRNPGPLTLYFDQDAANVFKDTGPK